jgi:xylulokinase
VVCGSNDTTVEFFGVGGVKPGIGAIKIATSAVLFLAVQGPSVHPPVSCYPHIVEGMYYTATGTNSCASAHRWLRDNMFLPAGAGEEAGKAAFAEMDLSSLFAGRARALLGSAAARRFHRHDHAPQSAAFRPRPL